MFVSFGSFLAVGPSRGHTSSRLVLQSSNSSITLRSCITEAGWPFSVEPDPNGSRKHHEPLQCFEKHYSSVEIMILLPPPPLLLVVSTTTTTRHINNPGKHWVVQVCNMTRAVNSYFTSVCLKFLQWPCQVPGRKDNVSSRGLRRLQRPGLVLTVWKSLCCCQDLFFVPIAQCSCFGWSCINVHLRYFCYAA